MIRATNVRNVAPLAFERVCEANVVAAGPPPALLPKSRRHLRPAAGIQATVHAAAGQEVDVSRQRFEQCRQGLVGTMGPYANGAGS